MPRIKKQHLKKRKDGRYCCKYHGFQFMGSTEEEALAAREDFKRQERIGVNPSSKTLGEYATYWLPIHKCDVKANTYNNYVSLMEIIIRPVASTPLSQLNTDKISEIYSTLNGKSASYIQKARILLTAILDSAVDAGYMEKNPCRAISVKPPNGTRGSHRAITDEEKRLIFNTPHLMQLPALLMLYCGLRRGEMLAISSDDISGDTLTVARAVYYISNQPLISTPKTESGIRTVPVPSILKPFLSDLTGLAAKGPNGSYMTEQVYQYGWQKYMDALSQAAGHPIHIRAHDLRHTYCTMLRDAGVDMKQAMLWMGHADEKMILRIYDHPGITREKEARKRIEMAFGMQNGMQEVK